MNLTGSEQEFKVEIPFRMSILGEMEAGKSFFAQNFIQNLYNQTYEGENIKNKIKALSI